MNKLIQRISSHPQVAVVIVVLTIHEGAIKVLLYQRERDPFAGQLSFPAGLMLENESLDQAAVRVLKEKTGVSKVFLEQLYTFGEPDRDPAERTVGVAYYSLLNYSDINVREEGAGWYDANKAKNLAFDHSKVLKVALDRTRSKMMYSNIVHGVLPEEFTLTDLQNVYEVIIGQKFDKRNFRKKILALNFLEDAKKKEVGKKQRPAALYKFKTRDTVLFKTEI